MDQLAEKQHARELLDNLDAGQLAVVLRLLESLTAKTPSFTVATAPIDDEPYTDEERIAVASSVEWLRHNQPIPHEQVLAEFGLTMADWEKMGKTPSRF